MLEFIASNMATIIVAAFVAVLVVLVIGKLIRDHKKGASACGNACSCCPNAALCHGRQMSANHDR